MKIVYRNPYDRKVEDVIVGDTTFRIDGMYNDGKGEEPLSDNPTAPVRPEFEITSIFMLVPSTGGDIPIDITKLVDDLNTISWRKDADNDIFEYFSEKVIKKFDESV